MYNFARYIEPRNFIAIFKHSDSNTFVENNGFTNEYRNNNNTDL